MGGWKQEDVDAVVEEEKEVASSSHNAKESVEHKKWSSRTVAAYRQGEVGLAASSLACLAAASYEV